MLQNWWTRECGGRDVLRIALPLVISTGSLSLMLFVDRMLLLWHSPAEMAAAMPAGMTYWTMTCFPLGLASFVNTFVAQYHGNKQYQRIGLVTWQGFRVGLYATPLFLCAIPLAPWIFSAAGHDTSLRAYEVIYFQILTLGSGAAVMSEALAGFFSGRGSTRVVMYANVAATLVNIVLDYLLIFGKAGFPELGMEGAAWATVAANWFKLVVYWLVIHSPALVTQYGIRSGRRWDAKLLGRLLLFGGPNGMQYLVECAAFTLITLKMAQFGESEMVATSLAFNVNSVAFVPIIGLGVAISTLVGQNLTRGHVALAARATWTGVLLALTYNAAFAALYLLVPDWIMLGHAAGISAERFSEIRELTITLLRFAAAFCLFDAMQVVFVGAIRGAGDTWFVLLNTFACSCLALTIGYLGAESFDGLYWWWTVTTGWVLALGITNLARFLQGRWRTMRVIETQTAELAFK